MSNTKDTPMDYKQFEGHAERRPPEWYNESQMYDWLIRENYSENIAKELSGKWAEDLQGAFNKGFEKAVNENPELKYLKHRLRTEGKENQSIKLELQKQKEEIEQLRAVIEKLLPLGEFLLNDTWDKRRLPANTHGIINEAKKLIKP